MMSLTWCPLPPAQPVFFLWQLFWASRLQGMLIWSDYEKSIVFNRTSVFSPLFDGLSFRRGNAVSSSTTTQSQSSRPCARTPTWFWGGRTRVKKRTKNYIIVIRTKDHWHHVWNENFTVLVFPKSDPFVGLPGGVLPIKARLASMDYEPVKDHP